MRCQGIIVLSAAAPIGIAFTLSLLSTDGSATPAGATGHIVLTLQPGSSEQFDFRVVHQVASAGRYQVQALLVPASDPLAAIAETSNYIVT